MSLISLRRIQLSFGAAPLLQEVDLTINNGERICLVGRNGAGKSTLMRVISGELGADDGERVVRQGAVVARLTQEVPAAVEATVFAVVAEGLGGLSTLLQGYHDALKALESDHDAATLERLSQAQHELDAANGWDLEQQVERVISRLGLDPDAPFAGLSGGLKRRVMLAQALVRSPDLLLLDEPTNHLDIASIDWLEEFLLSYQGSLLFVTHDRTFLRRLATRIIELDRGRLTDWPGDYDRFLLGKEAQLSAEAAANARFDKRLAEEEVWIRQGIKARRTRNEGRVRALEAMRTERSERRERSGRVVLAVPEGERSGRLVVEASGVSYRWGELPVISGLSTTILRGDKVGIIGPNGCGKSTLLNLLLGNLAPAQGTIRLGTNLEVAYFDQLRDTLDPERTVQDSVADGADRVTVGGSNRHVIGYLQDFLFAPERARQPVSALSGGERARLLLARLFTRPFNLLVMDEPTNDLDVETLELLEERLLEYSGTLLLVSHDRAFLNQVVTSTLVFEGAGRVAEYVGGYDDWLRQRPSPASEAAARPALRVQQSAPPAPPSKRLSYKEQRELEGLPERIAALEATLAQLHQQIADPQLYQGGGDALIGLQRALQQAEGELEQALSRWETLEAAGG